MKINKICLRMIKETATDYKADVIKCPLDAIKLVNKLEGLNTLSNENVLVVSLNAKNLPVNYSYIAKGGYNSCYIDAKDIFKTVLLSNACKFIMVHNHPSGDCTPSRQDIEGTKRIKEAAKLLDIELLDHIVIGGNNYNSCMAYMEGGK